MLLQTDSRFTDLVLVVDQQQDFGVVLVHEWQHERLQDGLGQGGGADVALLAKDGVEDVERGLTRLLQQQHKQWSTL